MDDPKEKKAVISTNDYMMTELDKEDDAMHRQGEASEELDLRGNEQDDNPRTSGPVESTEYIIDDLEYDHVINMVFESVEDAECFYTLYARATGFGIRRNDKKCGKDGLTRYRKWVCSREGERLKRHIAREDRKREPKAITRVKCPACFRVRYDENGQQYIVTEFVRDHKHTMARPSTIPFLRWHRSISEADYAQAKTLSRIGTRTSQIMRLFVLQSGSYGNVRFTLKDLYNKITSERAKEMPNGDAEGAIGYFAAKNSTEANFYFTYEVDEEMRLSRLFWADSQSRIDYKCFGDVLIFDTTYKTNDYNKPLVVLCGVNHHFSTTIFACALLPEEKTDTYEWVLEKFLEAMDGKQPVSVLTDGDNAMRKAIKKLFPQAKHRLCCWHLARNAFSNTQSKDFVTAMNQCMFKNCSPDQFDILWQDIVCGFGLEGNEWVNKTFRRRGMWAMAYLRGNFFAGMKSTQRCEKMNDFLKAYLKKTMKLYEFVQAFDLGIARLRNDEARHDNETENTSVLPATELRWLEDHAQQIYTRNIFFKVRSYMKSVALYDKEDWMDDSRQCIYFISRAYSTMTWRVLFNRETKEMKCSCMQFESLGLPCCHMIRVMLLENLKKFPETCIVKRWTREAKQNIETAKLELNQTNKITETARYAILSGACTTLCYYASKTEFGYNRMKEFIHKETQRMKELVLSNSMEGQTTSREKQERLSIRDPEYTRGKGDHGKSSKTKQSLNKCGKCGERDGHNKRTCKFKYGNTAHLDSSMEVEDCVGSDGEYQSGSQIHHRYPSTSQAKYVSSARQQASSIQGVDSHWSYHIDKVDDGFENVEW